MRNENKKNNKKLTRIEVIEPVLIRIRMIILRMNELFNVAILLEKSRLEIKC